MRLLFPLRLFSCLPCLPALAAPAAGASHPNILWILVEDMSPDYACYGEKSIQTPNVDRLAAEGIRFAHAFVTAPICSISRPPPHDFH